MSRNNVSKLAYPVCCGCAPLGVSVHVFAFFQDGHTAHADLGLAWHTYCLSDDVAQLWFEVGLSCMLCIHALD